MNSTFPQSRAETIGKSSCLAMAYLWCVGIDGTDLQYISYVSNAIDEGLLDEDCSVKDAEKYLQHFTGKRYHVEKKECRSIAEIVNPTPVRFYYYDSNGKRHEHWVGIENGEIQFNSYKDSACLKYGKPDAMRVITLAK